jgi:hypothetical protein
MTPSIRASRYRVPRTRGALSGFLLIALGAWAALVPFFGPYIDLAYTPAPNDAWHWTAARGWLEVLPGAAVFLGGLLLLASASRVVTMFGGWLAAAGGAWLIVGPPLADPLNLAIGTPDPTSSTGVRALENLVFFSAVGAAIVLLAGLALGRLSVLSVRDVRAAERRLAAEEAAEQAATPTAYRGEPDYRGAPDYRGEPDSAGRHGTREDGTPAGDGPGDGRPDYPQNSPEQRPYAQTAPPPAEPPRSS